MLNTRLCQCLWPWCERRQSHRHPSSASRESRNIRDCTCLKTASAPQKNCETFQFCCLSWVMSACRPAGSAAFVSASHRRPALGSQRTPSGGPNLQWLQWSSNVDTRHRIWRIWKNLDGWRARSKSMTASGAVWAVWTLTFLAQNEAMAVQRSVGVANQPLEPALLLLSPPGKPAKMQSSSQWQGSLKASEASKALGVSRPCSSQVNRKSIPVNHFESQSPVKSAESVLRALLHRRWYRLCTPQFCKAFRGDLLFKMAYKEVQGMLQFVSMCALDLGFGSIDHMCHAGVHLFPISRNAPNRGDGCRGGSTRCKIKAGLFLFTLLSLEKSSGCISFQKATVLQWYTIVTIVLFYVWLRHRDQHMFLVCLLCSSLKCSFSNGSQDNALFSHGLIQHSTSCSCSSAAL